MSEVSKKALEMARRAGRALPRVEWSGVEDVTTEEQRAVGIHHNPFDPLRQPEEYKAWLEGLAEGVETPTDHANLVKTIRDEIKVAERVS